MEAALLRAAQKACAAARLAAGRGIVLLIHANAVLKPPKMPETFGMAVNNYQLKFPVFGREGK